MNGQRMRGAIYYGRGDVRIEDRPVPQPAAGQLLVQVTRCGICGSDATEYAHGPRMFPVERRHPASGHLGPMVMGHEFIGNVVDGGADTVTTAGTRVASGAGVSCGKCDWCRAGRTNLCASYWTLGLSADGGLAQYVAVPESTCVEIPKGCSDDSAGLAQPLAVGLHASRLARITEGDTVVLIGAGAIGSFILCGLAGRGAQRVVALDIDDARLATARALGATDTVNVIGVDPVAAVRDLLPDGATVVVEASGSDGAAQHAASMAARGGRVLLVGLSHAPQTVDLAATTLREVDLLTTVAHVCGEDIPEALTLLTDSDVSTHLLDRVIALDQVVPDGLDALVARTVQGKILVDPWA
ncbi:MAG: hypothetical protein JWO57_1916 [Pseudonocardiales bacterium]|nr:hypothetical protein [Pseudonocardiales bacterium]